MRKNIILIFAGIFVLMPTTIIAHADEGLYDPLPPEGSAFLRFIQADDRKPVSPYVVRPSGEHKIVLAEKQAIHDLQEGQFYSAILKDGKITVLEDTKSENRAKALLLFYNLTDRPGLSLKTADSGIDIINNVARLEHGSREINAVRIGFALYDGDAKIASLEEQALDRNAAYSIFALTKTEGKAPELIFIRSQTDTGG